MLADLADNRRAAVILFCACRLPAGDAGDRALLQLCQFLLQRPTSGLVIVGSSLNFCINAGSLSIQQVRLAIIDLCAGASCADTLAFGLSV